MKLITAIILGFSVLILLAGTLIYIIIPVISLSQIILFYIIILGLTYIIYIIFRTLFTAIIGKKTPQPKQPQPPSPQTSSSNQIYPPLQQNINRMLYTVASIQFFGRPTKLIIEEKDITILKKPFIGLNQTEKILIKDILGTILSTGPIFASITIEQRTTIIEKQMREVKFLRKKEAIAAKALIDGLLLEHNKIIKIPPSLTPEDKRNHLIAAGRNRVIEKEL